MMEGDEDQLSVWTSELIQVLTQSAFDHEKNSQLEQSWLIRQHVREIAPGH